MARDLFDFMPQKAVADHEYERPKESETDPALISTVVEPQEIKSSKP